MGAKGLPIRDDVPAAELRRLARREKDRAAAARLQAIAGALEGLSRAEAARLVGLERQALRDAVLRYNEFLAQFAATLAGDEHAVTVLDRAGWHRARKLVIPSNVTLVWLPPCSPQLNPVERVWLYLRERHLSHRLLGTYGAVVAAPCRAWNALTTDRLHSLTSYPYLDQIKIRANRYEADQCAG